MKRSYKNLIMGLCLALLSASPDSYAQIASGTHDIEFKLNGQEGIEEELIPEGSKTKDFINEFRLSLGSQILDYQATSRVSLSGVERIETGYKGLVFMAHSDDDVISEDDVAINTIDNSSLKDLGSAITLNSAYENNAIGFNDSVNSSLNLSGKMGKFSFTGQYTQANHSVASAEETSPINPNKALASSRAAFSGLEPSVQKNGGTTVDTALTSDYYLEAVYNFKPTVKGKVAFKKSMIDTFDSKENVGVEGEVEATPDVSIKAGYSNEIRPETNSKSSNEKKVWTEFILKF